MSSLSKAQTPPSAGRPPQYRVTSCKVSAVSRWTAGMPPCTCHSLWELGWAWTQNKRQLQWRGNTFRARGGYSAHWLGRADCIFPRKTTDGQPQWYFSQLIINFVTETLSRFFNTVVTCLMEYWFKERLKKMVALLVLSPQKYISL